MSYLSRFLLISIFVVPFLCGCGSEPPPPEARHELTPSELFAAWLDLANAPADELDFNTAVAIAERLNAAQQLDLILNALGAPDTDPKARVLAVVSLTPYIQPTMIPRLKEFTAADRDSTTRACATKLLGMLDNEEARTQLRALTQEPDKRVRNTAVFMLARSGDAQAISQLPAIWNEPETDVRERTELLLCLPQDRPQDYLAIYREAAVNEDLEPELQARAIMALGQAGGPEDADTLNAIAAKTPIPELGALARDTAQALLSRGKAEEQAAAPASQEPATTTPAAAEPAQAAPSN